MGAGGGGRKRDFFGGGKRDQSRTCVEERQTDVSFPGAAESGNGRDLIGWVMASTILLFWAGGAFFSFHPAGVAAQLGSRETSEGGPKDSSLE